MTTKQVILLSCYKAAIGKWEADKSKPSIDNLSKICVYYETDVYKLLDEVSNVNFSSAKFKGSSYVINPTNSTINYSNTPEILHNQKQIIAMIEKRNELIMMLLSNS